MSRNQQVYLSQLQEDAIHILEDLDTVEVVFGGSGGGGKSMIIGILATYVCLKYPGVRVGIGRKDLSQLKKTTFATLLGKVFSIIGITPSDFRQAQDSSIIFKNGSSILPVELDYYPSDPDFNRLGSLEITMMMIDEVGELTEKSYNAIKARVGRWKNDIYNLKGMIFATCNPSRNFIRQYFYDPYIKLGGGQIQRWQYGYLMHNDERIPAYRAFIRASVFDNPFIEKSYIENLKTLPEMERRRLLDGDWNYADGDNSLFKASLLDKSIIYEIPEQNEVFNRFIGCDIADHGKDFTVFSLIDNGVLVSQKKSTVQMNWDNDSGLPMSRLIADELIEFAQRNGFTRKQSRHIAVECNGVGVGVRDMLKDRGWQLTEYIATHKSRSEGYYQLMLDMDGGDIKILNTLNGLDELRKQLQAHSYEMNNQVPSVCKKEIIKNVVGHSPDEADSFMIANWCKNWIKNPSNDPRRNKNRLIV